MADAITFVLNDESIVNSYGYAVRNSALDLTRFNNNPVMLYDHRWDSGGVIGRWENIRIEGTQLKADAVFDEDDETAVGIKGKVDRGFLKGCSIGFRYKYIETINGVDYFGGELLEASICAIPSNGGSHKLYESGQQRPVNEEQVTAVLSAAKNNQISNHQIQQEMEETKNLQAKIDALEAEKKELADKLTAEKQNKQDLLQSTAESVVESAIKDGKILATAKEDTIAMYLANPKQCANMLAGIPVKQSLHAEVLPANDETTNYKSVKELTEKLTPAELKLWIDQNKEEYSKLYFAEYGMRLS